MVHESRTYERPWVFGKHKKGFFNCNLFLFFIFAISFMPHATFFANKNLCVCVCAKFSLPRRVNSGDKKLIKCEQFLISFRGGHFVGRLVPSHYTCKRILHTCHVICIRIWKYVYIHTPNQPIRWTVLSFNVIVFVCILRHTFVSVPPFNYIQNIYVLYVYRTR